MSTELTAALMAADVAEVSADYAASIVFRGATINGTASPVGASATDPMMAGMDRNDDVEFCAVLSAFSATGVPQDGVDVVTHGGVDYLVAGVTTDAGAVTLRLRREDGASAG